MKLLTSKRQIGIRIPRDLDNHLENHVNKIGISKAAFILGLIYKELKKESLETNINDVEENIDSRKKFT